MRILMFHVNHFWYRPDEDPTTNGVMYEEALLVWVQSESQDEQDRLGVLRKMVKNIRWLAKKLETANIILHSFAHLGESKSNPKFADGLIEETATRLRERDYEVHIVPFGAFHEFKMHVKGPSLAKVFRSF